MRRLKFYDKIGHVSVLSEGLVFDSFCAWVENIVVCVEGLGAVDEGVVWPEQKEKVEEASEVVEISCFETRGFGFVPMSRGDCDNYEGMLRFHDVLVECPAEFEEALSNEFFWVGLSWHAVAICVRVQIQLWLDDGWLVPARLRRGMPEGAMRKHEEGSARCTSLDISLDVLLSGRFASQLKNVRRAPCAVCGFVGDTSRKTWLKGDRRKQDRRVFCKECKRAEYILEHDYCVDIECVLGEGSFGVVHRGFHVNLERRSAP